MNTSTSTRPAAAAAIALDKADPTSVAFIVTGRDGLSIKGGTTVTLDGRTITFAEDRPVACPPLKVGANYEIVITGDEPVAVECSAELGSEAIGGFHYAPGGNAAARTGGDDVPAINPCSLWDIEFRPACADPRGMAFVADSRGGPGVTPFWVDIYLLNTDHLTLGTSAFGATIADGRERPTTVGGSRTDNLNYETAVATLQHHGKQLLSLSEFFAAAFGVAEKTAAGTRAEKAGLDAVRTSGVGMMMATGQRYVWGHDGDPDEPRASVFGGYWDSGEFAGSRDAGVDSWPDFSSEWIGARGRSDHLMPV